MSGNIAALLYLISGVLFILALRGLSSPSTSRQGNFAGMIGMAIAMITTLLVAPPSGLTGWALLLVGLLIGGGFGAILARRIAMTAMPQLVAFFHSLVGLAAVFVAAGALYAPDAFHIATAAGGIKIASIVEMSLGVAIGAITFTGSIIAFLKLNGNMSGKPIMLPSRHLINIVLAVGLVVLIILFMISQSTVFFWLITAFALLLGILIIIPIGGADMPVVVSMLNSYSGWAAAGIGFTLSNMALIITGALVGSSGAILSYIMCRAMNRQFLSVIAGGFGSDGGKPKAASTGEQPAGEGGQVHGRGRESSPRFLQAAVVHFRPVQLPALRRPGFRVQACSRLPVRSARHRPGPGHGLQGGVGGGDLRFVEAVPGRRRSTAVRRDDLARHDHAGSRLAPAVLQRREPQLLPVDVALRCHAHRDPCACRCGQARPQDESDRRAGCARNRLLPRGALAPRRQATCRPATKTVLMSAGSVRAAISSTHASRPPSTPYQASTAPA